MSDLIKKRIRPEILNLSPYHVQPIGDAIKLDAMENPYTWDSSVQDEWLDSLKFAELNRYPDPKATVVLPALRKVMGVPESMEVMLGNGSDELIQILLMALHKDSVVMAPTPSFVMYKMISQFVDLDFVEVPLAKDFSLNEAATLFAMETHKPAVLFIANPNNPTGNLFSRETIEKIIVTGQKTNTLVVLDEAYHSFASDSFMADLEEYDNLLVMRTVSKMGLAGIRLGMLAGSKAWITELDKIRLPYNINILTQKTAAFILNKSEVLVEQTEQIKVDRTVLFAALESMKGVTPYKSEANFILFKVAGATEIHAKLKQKNILIKNLDGSHDSLQDCLRVSVGTTEENDSFVSALQGIVVA